ncbi:MAG TPA: hypothetical protein ENK40_04930 [Gammaproteobacteria bacterium]|nr:hypothetical protein [Gammaproteobacteria bacterium]
MAMSIDRILSDAVNGAQQGLMTARKNSAQLAAAGGGEASESEQKTDARVEKAADADLGKLVDVKA